MAIKRYINRIKKSNNSILIQKILDLKNINSIVHYKSANIKMPTYLEKAKITTDTVVWKRGDKLYKYAEKYYSNPELWWVIGLYNNKPTDAHFQIGDVFLVPTDLRQLLEYMVI